MLRAVPDVNVLVSALITPTGPAGRIMDAWRRDEITFITSQPIIDKVDEVLRRPHLLDTYPIDVTDIQQAQLLLQEEAVVTPHTLDLHVIKEDPEDDNILIAAVEGKADCIISGDNHLKKLGTYQGIPILSPTEFVTQHKIL